MGERGDCKYLTRYIWVIISKRSGTAGLGRGYHRRGVWTSSQRGKTYHNAESSLVSSNPPVKSSMEFQYRFGGIDFFFIPNRSNPAYRPFPKSPKHHHRGTRLRPRRAMWPNANEKQQRTAVEALVLRFGRTTKTD